MQIQIYIDIKVKLCSKHRSAVQSLSNGLKLPESETRKHPKAETELSEKCENAIIKISSKDKYMSPHKPSLFSFWFCFQTILAFPMIKFQPMSPKQENDTIVYRLNDMGSTDQDANYIRQFFYETTA